MGCWEYATKRCSCGGPRYCSSACQHLHWRVHKPECRQRFSLHQSAFARLILRALGSALRKHFLLMQAAKLQRTENFSELRALPEVALHNLATRHNVAFLLEAQGRVVPRALQMLKETYVQKHAEWCENVRAVLEGRVLACLFAPMLTVPEVPSQCSEEAASELPDQARASPASSSASLPTPIDPPYCRRCGSLRTESSDSRHCVACVVIARMEKEAREHAMYGEDVFLPSEEADPSARLVSTGAEGGRWGVPTLGVRMQGPGLPPHRPARAGFHWEKVDCVCPPPGQECPGLYWCPVHHANLQWVEAFNCPTPEDSEDEEGPAQVVAPPGAQLPAQQPTEDEQVAALWGVPVDEYRAAVDDANDDYYRYRAPIQGGSEGSPVSDVPLNED